MIWAKLRGRGSVDEGEKCWLSGYNGTGAEIAAGTPVCWSEVASDGKTLKAPVTTCMNMAAGIAEEAVGTAEYSSKIVAYGTVNARVYGVATNLVPGVRLWMIPSKSYLAYDTAGYGAQVATAQAPVYTALQTNATTDTCTNKVFVQAL